jgi:hypothetical protein
MTEQAELPLEFGNRFSQPTDQVDALAKEYPNFKNLTLHNVTQGFTHWMVDHDKTKATFEITKLAERSLDPEYPDMTIFETRIKVTDVA